MAERMWKWSTRTAVGGDVLFAGDGSKLNTSVGTVCVTDSYCTPQEHSLRRRRLPGNKALAAPSPAAVRSIFIPANLSPWIWRWRAFQRPPVQGAFPPHTLRQEPLAPFCSLEAPLSQCMSKEDGPGVIIQAWDSGDVRTVQHMLHKYTPPPCSNSKINKRW